MAAVKEWPVPRKLAETRAFVALASYYRRHISHFADIARPLHELTRKDQPFHWGKRQKESFEELKSCLTSAPIIAASLPEGQYILDTDASDQALGAVLQQKQGKDIRIIAYASRALNSAEKNYCTIRKELFAIAYGLKQFRHYLLLVRFMLRTDHAALASLLRAPEPVGQQSRWLDLLSEYNFEIIHRAKTRQGERRRFESTAKRKSKMYQNGLLRVPVPRRNAPT